MESESGLIVLSIFKSVDVSQIPSLIWTCFGLLLCLVLTSICAASENSLFSHREKDIEELRNENSAISKHLLYMLARPKYTLATILVVNSFGVVAFVLLSNIFIDTLFNIEHNPYLKFFVDAVVITLIILIFGEVMPKVYGTHYYQKAARIIGTPLRFFMWLFKPLTHALVVSSFFIEKRIRTTTPEISADELNQAIDIATDPQDASQEKEILKGIVNIGQIWVTQIMRPRLDIVALNTEMKFAEVLAFISENKYSRMPVYHENSDNVLGILYTKDVVPYINKGDDFKWQNLVRDALFVPENKKIDNLLKEFKEKRNHMAIVVDEFGGTQGLVSMEDIFEEVFGEIHDEYDEVEDSYTMVDENTYLFEGKTQLVDFLRHIGFAPSYFDNEEIDSDTLGGFIIERNGKIPLKGKTIKFQDLSFTIDAANLRKIIRIKVHVNRQNA